MHQGLVQEYLSMTIDYSDKENVWFTLPKYIDKLIVETADALTKWPSTTPGAAYLFNTNDTASKLSNADTILYHHVVANLLYLTKKHSLTYWWHSYFSVHGCKIQMKMISRSWYSAIITFMTQNTFA